MSAADDIALSTGYGRENGWVAVHQYKGAPYHDYFQGVEAIMDDYGGRPHWGKMHFQTAATLRERYPEWDAFATQRGRLDPDGTFRNDYLDRVLGPIGDLIGDRPDQICRDGKSDTAERQGHAKNGVTGSAGRDRWVALRQRRTGPYTRPRRVHVKSDHQLRRRLVAGLLRCGDSRDDDPDHTGLSGRKPPIVRTTHQQHVREVARMRDAGRGARAPGGVPGDRRCQR